MDKVNLGQFGRAMKHLGIELIPAYSPEARGRSERAFATPQGRWPQELAAAGIATREAANRYLEKVYRPAFNAEFQQPAREEGSAFPSSSYRSLASAQPLPSTSILYKRVSRKCHKARVTCGAY